MTKRYKPLYKQLLKIRENIQDRKKCLKFKKKKWQFFIEIEKRKKNRRRRQIKLFDLARHNIRRYNNFYSRKYSYQNTLKKKFKLFYGKLSERQIKKVARKLTPRKALAHKHIKNQNHHFVQLFERRLDSILYRANYTHSILHARQLILHKKVLVNDEIVRKFSFLLKEGDVVSIDKKLNETVRNNIKKTKLKTVPPRYVIMNYRTLEIYYLGFPYNYKYRQHFGFKLDYGTIRKMYYY